MTWTQWFIFLLIIQAIHGLGTWKLYIKAGRQAWEAFIPVYNGVVLMKIINRPWWWIIIMFLPIVNLIMLIVVWVETARSFGKNTYLDTFLAVVTLGFYNFYLNYVADVTYVKDRDVNPKSSSGEWTSSILFAIVAATIVHTYFIQPFTIPSSSLEKSLLVGDFLFVSKFHYGARVPMTTVAAPMVHDTIPVLNKKSYLFDDHKDSKSWKNKLQLPYLRLPGFEKIERNDIVVFNQPADTLLDMNNFTPDRNYYKPIDKKTNLVKRCVGVPGDSLEIRDGYVYINGKKNELPDRAQLQHYYTLQSKIEINKAFVDKYEIENYWRFYKIETNLWDNDRIQKYLNEKDENGNLRSYLKESSRDSLTTEVVGFIQYKDMQKLRMQPISGKFNINLTAKNAEIIKNLPNTISLNQFSYKLKDPTTFPHDPAYNWNFDNFGPIFIPGEGLTINLNLDNLPIYKRLITEYEGNTLQVKGNQILINDQVANTYTCKQDYYWMMGDNRNNSIDARGWGFTPFNHVLGKPVFIWMSWDGFPNARWERFFTTVGGSGKATSYFIPFLIALFGWVGFSKWRKRKKSNS
ncbi:signal peptidase I [Sabulilitoribacter multivorans]|uniref:Signal peptidase I n=1 Tax=Flaviramulus multivorans TaxID=1304750 RepID=A0ABS9IKB8_9FLAO|nr:signal peptidase I [Flaviramulus multivorans]MCF7561049.1 signal peptidase I [Flaviramulus multivorans]